MSENTFVTHPEMSAEEFDHLFRIAYGAAAPALSTSARNNISDDVASKAVYEYWAKIARGEVVENPEGLVTVIARRRALNARKEWARRRDLRLGGEEDDFADDEMGMFVLPPGMGMSDLVGFSSHEIARVIEAAALAGGDEMDVEIGLGLYLRGRTVEELAEELGIAEKTVRNRATAIKERIRRVAGDGIAAD